LTYHHEKKRHGLQQREKAIAGRGLTEVNAIGWLVLTRQQLIGNPPLHKASGAYAKASATACGQAQRLPDKLGKSIHTSVGGHYKK
jgi:hypothetical protein